MAESTELVDKEVGTVEVCDKYKNEKATNEGVCCNTQVSQPKEPAENGENSGVLCLSTTPQPGSSKRSRSPGFEVLSQKIAPPKFARKCKKCGEIRSSLKLEIGNLKKANAREVKKLREDVESLRKDKGQLRNSVNFLQTMYSNLLRENANLKSKNSELKKIIMLEFVLIKLR